jgi:hypothetical protein
MNARIKKNVLMFADLDAPSRRKIKDLLQEALVLADQVKGGIIAVQDTD